jgi:hypothetical protein
MGKPVTMSQPVAMGRPITQPVAMGRPITQPVAMGRPITQPVAMGRPITQPVVTQPVVTQPVVTRPVVTRPVVTPNVTEFKELNDEFFNNKDIINKVGGRNYKLLNSGTITYISGENYIISNTGSIVNRGNTAISGSGKIVNYASIVGDINFLGEGNSLVLEAGYSIDGRVYANKGDKLILSGISPANFDLSKIGSQYNGFSNLTLNAPTTQWNVSNSTELPLYLVIGEMIVSNSLSVPKLTYKIDDIGTAQLTVKGTATLNNELTFDIAGKFDNNTFIIVSADKIEGQFVFTEREGITLQYTDTSVTVTVNGTF